MASETNDNETKWAFREGDTIEEIHEQYAAGGVPLGRSQYEIKRRLLSRDGERFYHVDTEEGTHLYAASAIEHSYEVIDRNNDTGSVGSQ